MLSEEVFSSVRKSELEPSVEELQRIEPKSERIESVIVEVEGEGKANAVQEPSNNLEKQIVNEERLPRKVYRTVIPGLYFLYRLNFLERSSI